MTSRPDSLRLLLAFVVAGIVLPAAATEVFETATTDRKPAHTVVPEYPEVARRDRIEGEVQVCFEITREGRTRRVAVRNSTHRIFEKPARRAVKESTYVPLPTDAEVPAIKACRTFRFSLEPITTDDTGQSSSR